MSFNIGKIKIKNKGVLAPMLEYTTLPFRLLCQKYGCALTYSEMVYSHQINYLKDLENIDLTSSCKKDSISTLQIVGNLSNKDEFLNAIHIADKYKFFDIIDINMGCPSDKVNYNNSGSILLKNIDPYLDLIKECKETISKPLSVKIRLGYQENKVFEIANKLINTNIDALAIHGRRKIDDYSIISKYKEIDSISKDNDLPIIYNGDVNLDTLDFFNNLSFSGLMVGRYALSNPTIFKNIKKQDFSTNYKNTKVLLKEYLKFADKYPTKFNKIKITCLQLLTNEKNCRAYRNKISTTKNVKELKEIINDFF